MSTTETLRGVSGQRYSIRISAGGFMPSSCVRLITGSLPRGNAVLLNNVGKARFVHEKWNGAPYCRRGEMCILDSNLKGTGMPFFGIETAENSRAKLHLFHWSHCLHTGCSPPWHQLSLSRLLPQLSTSFATLLCSVTTASSFLLQVPSEPLLS